MKFKDLMFQDNPLGCPIAVCHIDGYRISVITGDGSYSDKEHPYELYFYPGCNQPFGWLTEQDVEYFINNKCYMDTSKFREYLQSR